MAKKVLAALALASLLLWQATAFAQAPWPDTPFRMIVWGGAGSATDAVARVCPDALAKKFGQPFVIGGKAGANGLMGTEAAVKSPNDGYTLLFTYAGAQVVNPSLIDKIPVDVCKDFAAIAQIGGGGNLLVVPSSTPVKDMKEFMAFVKSKTADELSYGCWGNGSGGHLGMEAIKQQAGIKVKPIPYKTSAAANQDLLVGHVQASLPAVALALPLVQSGRMKALACSGTVPVRQLPQVESMTAQDVTSGNNACCAMFARAGTPVAIVNSLNAEINRLIQAPEMAERWNTLGFSDMPIKTSEQFADQVRRDVRDYAAIAKAGNIKPD